MPSYCISPKSKLKHMQSKMGTLRQIETDMFEQFKSKQDHNLQQLYLYQNKITNCKLQRPKHIRDHTFQQIVTHPCNGSPKQSGHWRGSTWNYLANFSKDMTRTTSDLTEIEQRALDRKLIREGIERERRQTDTANLKKLDSHIQHSQGELPLSGKASLLSKKKKKSVDIPFGLQRELYRKEVQQNKGRLQKADQYKRVKLRSRFN